MKYIQLIALMLILCMILTLCSCAKKDEETNASIVEQNTENTGSEEAEDIPQDSTPDNQPSNTPPANNNNNPDSTQKPSDNNTSHEGNNSETLGSSQNTNNNTNNTDSNNSVSYDPSKYYISSKSDIVMGSDADLFIRNNNGSYTAVFSDVNSEFTQKYMTELTKKGFKKYTESAFNGSGSATKNTFATFTSDAYSVDLGFHQGPARLYVTYSPIEENTVLPATEKPKYTACGMPTIITQVGAERFHKEAVSMCYIIRAADGSFIVYDSDYGNGMAELIYDVLKKQAPDPNNIVISAWFVTHPHMDHVGAFIDFADKYAGDKTITLKQMVYNYSNDEHVGDVVQSLMRKTPIAAKKLNPNVEFLTPHAGNVLYYADLTFNVLYTQEEYLAPTNGKIEDTNGASLVTQMITDSGVKILLGGDHPVSGTYEGISFCEGALYKWYGEFIRSDIVTHFHHGFGGGADLEIFKHIRAKILLWPATFYRLTHDSDGTPYDNIEFNARNKYYTDPAQAKKNGVKGYYISGDKIHIVDLSNKNLEVTEYSHSDEYLGKK